MAMKYFGKKKIYETLKSKGYKLPKMKDMGYKKYRGSEWLESSSFDEERVCAYAEGGKRISAREISQNLETEIEIERSSKVFEGDNMDCVYASRYGKCVYFKR